MAYVRFRHPDTQRPLYGRISDDQPDAIAALQSAPWHDHLQLTGEQFERGRLSLLPPCEPSKMIGVEKNYATHAAEMAGITGDGSLPSEPLLFLKPSSSLLPDGGQIVYPQLSQRVDYEGELAVVVGQPCRNVSWQDASLAIFGYTIANDVTARDLQVTDRQWTRAKGFDTFCPLGPQIVTQLPNEAQLETRLNGQIVQSAALDQMVFSPAHLIAYISQFMTLWPGDVILTGPSGVGPLQVGDEVRVTISGIGTLTNGVVESLKL
jgi:2-keto-4-pentenoate hydratase/2-oxohepta-3-ene-1,7-dioic acid hydratase in catechol pathway